MPMAMPNPQYTRLSSTEFERDYCCGRSLSDEDILRTVPEDIPCERVWTVLDADGTLVVCNGYHVVNFYGYVISDLPYSDATWSYEVDWEDRDKLVVQGRQFSSGRVRSAHDAIVAARTGQYDVYEMNDPAYCADGDDMPQVDPTGCHFVAVGSLLGAINVYGPFASVDDLDLVGEACRGEEQEWAAFAIRRDPSGAPAAGSLGSP